MGRRSRRRSEGADALRAPDADYTDADGNVLTLRGVLSAKSRRQYAGVLAGTADRPGAAREDAWHRAAEVLFERLAVRWTIAGVPTDKPKELLQRYRMASGAERDWIRSALRDHVAEHFPDVQAP